MPVIEISSIEVTDRQRKKMEAKPLADLQDSIREHGLLQPIGVLALGDKKYRLIWGERRLKAISQLHDRDVGVMYGGFALDRWKIAANVLQQANLVDLLRMEFDENKIREGLTWQEEMMAIDAIVKARQEADHGLTQTAIAKELSEASGEKKTVASYQADISRASAIAAALPNRPDLNRANSARQAYDIILKEQREKFLAERQRRNIKKASVEQRLWDMRHGDAKEIMTQLEDERVDLILVDPPYGQDANKERYAAGLTHRYDDSETYAQDLSVFIIQEGWRVTKKSANLFMFCSWKSFGVLFEAAQRYGWSPWYHPLIWYKGEGGHSPWGERGVRHDYECFLYATKGQRGVKGPISDVQCFNKVGSLNKVHGAEKPINLLEFLVDVGSNPYDVVLDPCAGSGSTLIAAANKGRRSIGIELDELYFNRAMTRLGDMKTQPAPTQPASIAEVDFNGK